MNSTVLILFTAAVAFWYLSKKGTSSSADTNPGATAGQSVYTGLPGNLFLPATLTTPSTGAPALNFTPNLTKDQVYANAASGAQTLGDIYLAMRNYTADIGQDFTAAQWNSIVASVSTVVPPDPAAVWGSTPTRQMRIQEYWANVAPWLAANRGMSGLGATRLVQTHGGWTA